VTLDDFPPWFLRAFAVLFGLVWGSFLNVVIYRVPRGMSVVRPASHCPACGEPIRAWDNVPVLGYLLLRGRARCCGAPLSPRYPLVEAIGGVLSLAVLEAVVFRLSPTTAMPRALAVYVADLALCLGLVAAAFIDLEHMILPDSITLGGAVLGLATCSFRQMTFARSLLGAAVGFGVVWLPFVVIYPRIRGRVGMGLGDAKLLLLAGAWFGWDGALFVLGAGAVQGTIATIGILLARGRIDEPEAVKREREEVRAELAAMSPEERAEAEKELAGDPVLSEEPPEGVGQARMAFGPFLMLGILECLLIGRDVLSSYVGWIDPS
jgi:leader peptidase (prepilin peptidase) / N-methyltransferase